MAQLQSTIAQDEIDWNTPRSRQTARRNCRACNASYVVGLDHDGPPLCPECASDIAATRERVKAWLAGVLAQMDVALETWERVREPRQAYWERIQDARERPGYQEKAAAHRAAQNAYGQLLEAEETMLRTMQPLGVERERLEAALEVLREL